MPEFIKNTGALGAALRRRIGSTRPASLLVLVCTAVALAACYMPVRFDAEITIHRTGHYDMIFDGYLARVQLYEDIRQGKLTPAEEQDQVDKFLADLRRDRSVTEAEYIRQGIYRVHWENRGDMLQAKYVTFLRRNENMLSLSYVRDDGTVSLQGASITRQQRQQLSEIGLGMTGELRVITDANVVAQNATTDKPWPDAGPGYRMYVWEIANIYAPTPRLVIQLH